MWDSLDYRNAALFLFWAVIFARAHQLKSFGIYPFFYLYVLVSASSLVVSIFAISLWGISSSIYFNLYTWGQLAYQASTFFFLVWLVSLPSKTLQRKDITLIVVFLVAAVLVEFWLPSASHFILHFSRAGTFFLVLVAFLATVRCLQPTFEVGRNMGVALGATFFMLLAEFLNASLYLSQLWEYKTWRDFFDFSSVAAWGVIAWGMLGLDKPKLNQ